MFYWLAKYVFIGPFLRGVWLPWTEGLENIPDDRPVIIASNHLSFCDSFFMPVMVPRKVTFLAKAEYFTTPGIKGLFSRMFMSAVGQVP
ncbi:MAG: 1-acyl-sn-glycerol-3-phosphate acyltransferase, partial [Pseudonocardiales bacterium]|nr:1-acyl-sn-glycerol-3-phosphate acyltransferase [Pseudonocardiales bacterium]